MPKRPPTHLPPGREVTSSGRTKEARTLTARERGYDGVWETFRLWFLDRHPICSDCEARGQVTPTRDIHHVLKLRDRFDLRCDESNCLGLCASCHATRTVKGE